VGFLMLSQASGSIVATKAGAPHLMGVAVQGGERPHPLKAGMQRISITGTTSDGHPFTMEDLVCVDPAKPTLFFHKLAV